MAWLIGVGLLLLTLLLFGGMIINILRWLEPMKAGMYASTCIVFGVSSAMALGKPKVEMGCSIDLGFFVTRECKFSYEAGDTLPVLIVGLLMFAIATYGYIREKELQQQPKPAVRRKRQQSPEKAKKNKADVS